MPRNVVIGPYCLHDIVDESISDCTVLGFGNPPDDMTRFDPFAISYAEVVGNVNCGLGLTGVFGVQPLDPGALSGKIAIQMGDRFYDMRELLEAAEARRDRLAAAQDAESLAAALAPKDLSAMSELIGSNDKWLKYNGPVSNDWLVLPWEGQDK